jgi:hypothetical protein
MHPEIDAFISTLARKDRERLEEGRYPDRVQEMREHIPGDVDILGIVPASAHIEGSVSEIGVLAVTRLGFHFAGRRRDFDLLWPQLENWYGGAGGLSGQMVLEVIAIDGPVIVFHAGEKRSTGASFYAAAQTAFEEQIR